MKVIIVGAGISGLSTYLFLQKYCSNLTNLEIAIYDSHDPQDSIKPGSSTFGDLSSYSAIIGGGIGLSPNGCRLIRELDQKIYEQVKSTGFTVERFVFKGARGWRLTNVPTSDMRGKPGMPDGEEEFCISISRHDVWKALIDAVGHDKVDIKKVVAAKKALPAEGKKPMVIFDDGSEEQADLVIGADGVRSVVLRSIFGDEKSTEPQYE